MVNADRERSISRVTGAIIVVSNDSLADVVATFILSILDELVAAIRDVITFYYG